MRHITRCGTRIALNINGRGFPSFPRSVTFRNGKEKTMKVLQKILSTFAIVIGLTLAISAQKNDDQKKPPPKVKPPVVTPGNKRPPKNNDDKPRKSSANLIIASKKSWAGLA